MTSTAVPTALPTAAVSQPAPRRARRALVALAAVPACALPTVWGLATVSQLVTGTETDHRFHQLTGQGLLLSALWLGGLAPLVVAGTRGRRPSPAAALHLLAFLAATVAAAVLSPGGGAAPVAGIAVVTSALLWAALPLRPRLRPAAGGGLPALDPLRAPQALLTAALLVPYALSQASLQRTPAPQDEHAALTHYFDMAWVALALVALAVVGALSPRARSRSTWSAAGVLVLGAARAAFVAGSPWTVAAVALGLAGLLAAGLARRAA